MQILLTSDSRYHLDRQFVKKYLLNLASEKGLPDGIISVAFVGSRAAKRLAAEYLKDNTEHPVLTFPLSSKQNRFPETKQGNLLGEIVICYPQVTLYAAEQGRTINAVISHFLDHAVSVLKSKIR